jgi:glycosyltransferase involved in cell wall biosynthesis
MQKKAKPKLLIVGAFPPANSQVKGGIVTACRTLISSDFSSIFDCTLIDSTQLAVPAPAVSVRGIYAAKRFCAYLLAIAINRPDAVLLFASVGASILEKGMMAWVARLVGIPTFLFPRGAGLIDTVRNSRWQRIWVTMAMRGATHLLCQGPAWQRFAINDLGYSKQNAPIIPNWTATDDIMSIGRARRMDSRDEKVRILYVGWLESEKGCFELIEASHVLAKEYRFELTLVGGGKAEGELKQLVERYNLSHRIRFEGWADKERMISLLESADCLVHPSWEEGFPNAVIEAMAARLAVIVTAVGNVPEMLAHKVQAILVPPKDAPALELAMREVLGNPTLRNELAASGFKYTQQMFSAKKNIDLLSKAILCAI